MNVDTAPAPTTQAELHPRQIVPLEAAAYYAESSTNQPEAWQDITDNFDQLTEIAVAAHGPKAVNNHLNQVREEGFLIPHDIAPNNTATSLSETWSLSEKKGIKWACEEYLDPKKSATQTAQEHLDANLVAVEALSKINNTIAKATGKNPNYTFNDLVKTTAVIGDRGFPIGKTRVYNDEILDEYTKAAQQTTPIAELIEESLRQGKLYNYQKMKLDLPESEFSDLQKVYDEQQAILDSRLEEHPEAAQYLRNLWIHTFHDPKRERSNIKAHMPSPSKRDLLAGMYGSWKNRKASLDEKAEFRFVQRLSRGLRLTPELAYAILDPKGSASKNPESITWNDVIGLMKDSDHKSYDEDHQLWQQGSIGIDERKHYSRAAHKFHEPGIETLENRRKEQDRQFRRFQAATKVGPLVLNAPGIMSRVEAVVKENIQAKFAGEQEEPESRPTADEIMHRMTHDEILYYNDEDARVLFPDDKDFAIFKKLQAAMHGVQDYMRSSDPYR